MKVLLCGLPNVGKTACGKAVAQQLGWTFIDLDQQIEAAYGSATGVKRTGREIYCEEGESVFRAWEQKALVELKEEGDTIIALGGGVLEMPENRRVISRLGHLIYLRCFPEVAFERMGEKVLPFLDQKDPQSSFLELAKRRHGTYQDTCSSIIDVGSLDIETVADLIINQIKGMVRHGE